MPDFYLPGHIFLAWGHLHGSRLWAMKTNEDVRAVKSTAHLVPPQSRRMPRLLQRKGTACYHVVSRINARAFLLTDAEKEVFRDLLRRVAGFCGVTVLTYALLDNHFHLLVEVPQSAGELDDDALLKRASLLYGNERKGQPLSYARIALALQAGGDTRERMRRLLMGRMASLPMFVKILKQRYSVLYNRKHDRLGTLWEDRFHSVLVENCPRALRAVGAYIDLNAVRAGIVRDPKDYRFSGYGEALGTKGGFSAYPLFQRLAGERKGGVQEVASEYRKYLYLSASNRPESATITEEACRKVVASGGDLSPAQVLHCRLRYMTRGVVLGSQAFLARWSEERRKTSKRTTPPRPSASLLDTDLATLR
jgi:putative transposase